MNILSLIKNKRWDLKNADNFNGEITGFSIDTRKINPGECFVAFKTEQRDGHLFLNSAKNAGASCALVERFVEDVKMPQIIVTTNTLSAIQEIANTHRNNFKGTVIGVTGSVGKTSTKDLLSQICSSFSTTTATLKNLNNLIGVPLSILSIPEKSSKENFAIIESGMSVPGEIEQSAKVISPDIAIITNVFPAHLEGLLSLENIAKEKSDLARNISPCGIAVFPANLLKYTAFKTLLCPKFVISKNENDELIIENLKKENLIKNLFVSKASFQTNTKTGTYDIHLNINENREETIFKTNIFSRGLAENTALIIIALLQKNIPSVIIQNALLYRKASKNRGEIIKGKYGIIFSDCYNASPASMVDSVETFIKQIPPSNKRLFILGGMNELGESSKQLHFSVGEKIAKFSQNAELAVFGGNAFEIANGAESKHFPSEKIHRFNKIEELKTFSQNFIGDQMIKASRGFALERLLDDLPQN